MFYARSGRFKLLCFERAICMGVIVAIVNQKGGVGKTTTAMNIAAYLTNAEKKCLLVDLDPQANATSGMGLNPTEIEHGTYEALVGMVQASSAIRIIEPYGIHLLPATIALAGASVELVTIDEREFQLLKAIQPLTDVYDYIFIDCPPSLGLLTLNGLVASDHVLIPVQAEYFALEGIGQLMETINLVKQHLKPNLSILGAIITMYDKRYKLSVSVLQELYRHFPQKIFRTVIPRSVRLAEAPSHGKSILHYDPESRGGKAYERFAKELLASLQSDAALTP